MGGKSGSHNPDDVLIGMMDSPEVKALLELVAKADGESNTSDWMRRQIFTRALAHGMMVEGKVVGEWKDRVVVRAAAIRQEKREKSEARKAARNAKKHHNA